MKTVKQFHARVNSGKWPVTAFVIAVLSLIAAVIFTPTAAYSDIDAYRLFGAQLASNPLDALNPFGEGSTQPYPLLIAPLLLVLSFTPPVFTPLIFLTAVAFPATVVGLTAVHRVSPYGRSAAIWLASLTLVMGGGYWLRLEPIIVMVFAVGLCAALGRRTGTAYGWLLVAAAAKLIPIVGMVAVPLPAHRPRLSAISVIGVMVTVVVFIDICRSLVVTFGRGMQVESLPALPMMAARALGDDSFTTFFKNTLPDLCLIVVGPQGWLTLFSLLGFAATVMGAGFALWRLWSVYGVVAGVGANWKARLVVGSRNAAPAAQMATVLALTAAVLAGGKVFSPQYVAMLAVPAVVLYAVTANKAVFVTASATVVLSFVVWPHNYYLLLEPSTSVFPVTVLALRAAALISLYFVAVRLIRPQSASTVM